LLCCVTVAAGVVPDSEGAGASLRDVLAAALDANREMARLAAVLREENARLRAEGAEQAAELERVRADLAVLQRMVFGRSSERARPEPSADGGDAGQGRDLRGSGTGGKKAGSGGAGGAAGLLASAPGRGGLGFRGRRVLLPGVRDAVHGPGQRSCDGAAGLAGDRAGAGGLPAPVPAGLLLPGPGDGDGARPAEGDRQGPFH
jgi:hypothetical protein